VEFRSRYFQMQLLRRTTAALTINAMEAPLDVAICSQCLTNPAFVPCCRCNRPVCEQCSVPDRATHSQYAPQANPLLIRMCSYCHNPYKNPININLNAGGVIGALTGGAIGVAIVLALTQGDVNKAGPFNMIMIGGLIAGAFAGNFIWANLFGKRGG
jgi:hypothetical protein